MSKQFFFNLEADRAVVANSQYLVRYSADDNVGAPLQFAKATAADLSLDNTAYQEPAGTVISVDVNTGIVTFQTRWACRCCEVLSNS